MVVIELYELPLDVSVQVTQYRYLHNVMGDYFIITCLNGTLASYVRVMEGYVFNYLVTLNNTTNPSKFNLIRATIPETGGYEVSINSDYGWKPLR
jgi:hypothetical protein